MNLFEWTKKKKFAFGQLISRRVFGVNQLTLTNLQYIPLIFRSVGKCMNKFRSMIIFGHNLSINFNEIFNERKFIFSAYHVMIGIQLVCRQLTPLKCSFWRSHYKRYANWAELNSFTRFEWQIIYSKRTKSSFNSFTFVSSERFGVRYLPFTLYLFLMTNFPNEYTVITP